MSTLTMPSINIAFQQAASTALARSQKGTVALILRDAALADKTYTLTAPSQLPTALGAANQAAVRRAVFWLCEAPEEGAAVHHRRGRCDHCGLRRPQLAGHPTV